MVICYVKISIITLSNTLADICGQGEKKMNCHRFICTSLLSSGYCQIIVIDFLFQVDNGKHFDTLHTSQETEQVSETILEKENKVANKSKLQN